MSALRSILVHLDPSPRSSRRLGVARELAARHGARVVALYASTPAVLSLPLAMAQGAGEVVTMLQQVDLEQRDAAKALFDAAVGGAAPSTQWRELRGEPVIPGVAAQALFADLLVFGQHDAADPMTAGVPPDLVASVLLASGRPALVIPSIDVDLTWGGNVLVAWKPTRECARALSAAIPFLRHAREIHLAIADDADGGADNDARGGQAAALEAYLRLHDVAAPVRRHASVASDAAGDALLSLAATVGADLLVMGCYGHSRARELVLGGASRTVLKTMTLPVLMAH